MYEDGIAAQIVDAAIAIHRVFGPGLLESAYVAALEIELSERGLPFVREVPLQGHYRGRPLGVVYRADLIIEDKVLIEVKSVQALEPIHIAQVVSYLRLSQLRLALLLNFNVPVMKRGIKRVANNM